LKSFAPIALRTEANIVEDVTRGKTWKDSAMKRVPETISKVAFGNMNQTGSGIRRRRRSKPRRKKAKRDIFSYWLRSNQSAKSEKSVKNEYRARNVSARWKYIWDDE
jgi:hypothetical protein